MLQTTKVQQHIVKVWVTKAAFLLCPTKFDKRFTSVASRSVVWPCTVRAIFLVRRVIPLTTERKGILRLSPDKEIKAAWPIADIQTHQQTSQIKVTTR